MDVADIEPLDGSAYRLASGELIEIVEIRADGVALADVVTFPGVHAQRQVEIPVVELATLEHLPAECFAWYVEEE